MSEGDLQDRAESLLQRLKKVKEQNNPNNNGSVEGTAVVTEPPIKGSEQFRSSFQRLQQARDSLHFGSPVSTDQQNRNIRDAIEAVRNPVKPGASTATPEQTMEQRIRSTLGGKYAENPHSSLRIVRDDPEEHK